MEAIVHVKVSLEEATIQSIGKIFTACIGGAMGAPKPLPPAVEARAAEAPAQAQKPVDDLPFGDPGNAIDNMTLNAAVKAAQGRVGADPIRAIFKEYGIASSRDCPMERRPDLLAALNAL